MQYKVVDGGVVGSGNPTKVAKLYEDIINKESTNGWEFYCFEDMTSRSCCGLGTPVVFKMLVFKK